MTAETAFAALATLVATAFGLSALERWFLRRRPHELAWSISLAMFATASGALWWGIAAGWSEASFRIFYLFGAVLNVPWLALGTVELLVGSRQARPVWWALVLVSGFAAGVLMVAPLQQAVSATGLPEGRDVFGPLPRVLAAVGSGVGALVLLGGALWSAVGFLRGAPGRGGVSARRLAFGNLLIAAGTLVLSASGTLAGRLGEAEAFAVTLGIGVVVLFCGFLVATPPLPRRSLGEISAQLAT